MISEIYDALKDASGVSDDKARRAAEAVAQFDTRFTDLKADINSVRTELKADISSVRTDLKADIAEVRADLETNSNSVRTDLKADIAEVRVDMEALKGRVNLVQWQLVALLGGVATLLLKAFF